MAKVEERQASTGPAIHDEFHPTNPRGFSNYEAVVVRQVDDTNWKVVAPLSYQAQRQEFRIPLDMETDFASVPRPLVWFLPRYGRYTKAAIVHDYLWREGVRREEVTRREADAIFRRAMRELDVAFLRRWFMWSAVRWGALAKRDGRRGWWRDAWRVVPLTALALPVVVPPAVLVVAALFVFYLVELVVWVPLKIVNLAKTAAAPESPGKQVNRPSLLFKL
jgi:uncharacterized protein DUF1353